ncbi:MAG: hypothetical protein ACREGR_03505, partial [Minisyncoccia bacterium]
DKVSRQEGQAMRKTRYVHKSETKFKVEKPKDGEVILFRMSGHKSYNKGTWDAKAEEVVYGDPADPCRTHVRYLMGWLPEWYSKPFP